MKISKSNPRWPPESHLGLSIHEKLPELLYSYHAKFGANTSSSKETMPTFQTPESLDFANRIYLQ